MQVIIWTKNLKKIEPSQIEANYLFFRYKGLLLKAHTNHCVFSTAKSSFMGITQNVPTWRVSAIHHPLHYLNGISDFNHRTFVRDHYALGNTKHKLQVTVASVAKEHRTMRTKTAKTNISIKSSGRPGLSELQILSPWTNIKQYFPLQGVWKSLEWLFQNWASS